MTQPATSNTSSSRGRAQPGPPQEETVPHAKANTPAPSKPNPKPESYEDNDLDEDAEEWSVLTDADGNIYFVNKLTGETCWEIPSDEDDADPSSDNDADHKRAASRSPSRASRRASTRLHHIATDYEIATHVIECWVSCLHVLTTTPLDELLPPPPSPGPTDPNSPTKSPNKKPKQKQKRFVSKQAEKCHEKNALRLAGKQKRLAKLEFVKYTKYFPCFGVEDDLAASKAAQEARFRASGSLFSSTDAHEWRVANETERIKKRFLIRKQRRLHSMQVQKTTDQLHLMKKFRSHLMGFLLSKQVEHMMAVHAASAASSSSNGTGRVNHLDVIAQQTEILLKKQKVLWTNKPTPYQMDELEIAELAKIDQALADRKRQSVEQKRKQRVLNIHKVFVLLDDQCNSGATKGQVDLLHLLFAMSTIERIREYAMQVPGLTSLVQDPLLQRFVFDFVACNKLKGQLRVHLLEFEQLVDAIEEITDHIANIKEAMEMTQEIFAKASTRSDGFIAHDVNTQQPMSSMANAGLDKGYTLVTSTQSASNKRSGLISKKQLENELALMQAIQKKAQETRRRYVDDAFQEHDSEAQRERQQQQQQRMLMELDEEAKLEQSQNANDEFSGKWQHHHHHRFIQIQEDLPLYCCLCRRKRWEMERNVVETRESDWVLTFPSKLAIWIKQEEIASRHRVPGTEDNAALHPSLDAIQPAASATATAVTVAEANHCMPQERSEESDNQQQHESAVALSSPTSLVRRASAYRRNELLRQQPAKTRASNAELEEIEELLDYMVLMVEQVFVGDEPCAKPPPAAEAKGSQDHDQAKEAQRSPKRKPTKHRRSTVTKAFDFPNTYRGQHHRKAVLNPHEHHEGLVLSEQQILHAKVKQLESEEKERRCMYEEEKTLQFVLEKNKRYVEKPFLRLQENALASFLHTMSHIVSPVPALVRLQFQRNLLCDESCARLLTNATTTASNLMVLGANAAFQQSVLLMRDDSEKRDNKLLVLQTFPCENAAQATFLEREMAILVNANAHQSESLQSIAKCHLFVSHLVQKFATSGLAVEKFPMCFCVVEYCPKGFWIQRIAALKKAFERKKWEFYFLQGLRDICAAISSLHSLGLLHLNLKLDNVYLNGQDRIKIAGLLAWKKPFDRNDLEQVTTTMLTNFSFATMPPELLTRFSSSQHNNNHSSNETHNLPNVVGTKANAFHKSLINTISDKVDVFLFGCLLFHALLVLENPNKVLATPRKWFRETQVIVHLEPPDQLIANRLARSTNPKLMSLLRMVLQPNPLHRPRMNEVMDFLAFANENFLSELQG